MSALESVLGVLGMCRVALKYSTQIEAPLFAASSRVCWVCWVWRRVRACVTIITPTSKPVFFSYARTDKPNQPNTPNTTSINTLFLRVFICVGFVLGCVFFVSGSFFGGKGQ